MSDPEIFSARQGISSQQPEIKVRDSAPSELRRAALHFAIDVGLPPFMAREALLELLAVPRAPELWNADDNIVKETHGLLERAAWFEVYDFIELINAYFEQKMPASAIEYQRRLNRYFERNGVGWKLANGALESCGSEAFEHSVVDATQRLAAADLPTAKREIHEALSDLSRRPNPDLTGAIQHAAAALECVAREATGDQRGTLGQILARNPDLLPAPLPSALDKLWGYASETARHVREGRAPSRDEAELTVGLAAVLAGYLAGKIQR